MREWNEPHLLTLNIELTLSGGTHWKYEFMPGAHDAQSSVEAYRKAFPDREPLQTKDFQDKGSLSPLS